MHYQSFLDGTKVLTIRERDRVQDKVSAIIVPLGTCTCMCTIMMAVIDFVPSMCKSLQSHATRLESDNTESRLKLSDFSDKVAAQSEIIEQLKVYIMTLYSV